MALSTSPNKKKKNTLSDMKSKKVLDPDEEVKNATTTTKAMEIESKSNSLWTPPTEQELIAELNEFNDFFDMLVEMIPQKLYVSQQQHSQDTNRQKNTATAGVATTNSNKNTEKPKVNRFYKNPAVADTKESRKAEAKVSSSKRRKLNDKSSSTTTAATATEFDTNPKSKSNNKNPNSNSETTATAAEPNTHTKNPDTSNGSDKIEAVSRIEALRLKLQERIEQIRSKVPRKKAELSKRQQRLQEKIKRREDALRNKKKLMKQQGDTSANTTYAAESSSKAVTPDMSVDLQTVDYGIIGGLNPTNLAKTNNYSAVNKSLANVKKPKNLHKLLSEAQTKQEKISEYKNSGNPEDQKKLQSIQWSDTLKEADGIRIKDDPTKIKKMLARKVAKKKKSAKSWQSRVEQQSTAKQEKQAIRKHNIEARKVGGKVGANLSSKRIISSTTDEKPTTADGKKKRVNAYSKPAHLQQEGGTATPAGNKSRPGFEGKKQGFLNSSSKKQGKPSN